MVCFHPLEAWYVTEGEDRGKVVFSRLPGKVYIEAKLPCGKCDGCRMEYSRQWAIRCMHEAEMHEENCMVTLTYNNENVNEENELRPNDVTLFLKRLRKANNGLKKIRYFYCGEYGDNTQRPHYHILFFGIDFRKKDVYNIEEINQQEVEKIWGKGYVEITPLTFESAAYNFRENNSADRLEVREKIMKAKMLIKKRSYENK